jgi:hypothetical protein
VVWIRLLCSRECRFLLAAMFMGIGLATSARAAVLDDVGFNRLKQELGSAISTGNGIAVAQSEASFANGFYPTVSHADFSGITWVQGSGSQTASVHATNVGRNFYGTAGSVAPEISSVANYTALGWLNEDYLHTLTNQLPAKSSARVANHSWISFGTNNDALNSLHRTDWLVETDDFIQVAGINNLMAGEESPAALFAGAFNVIAVGVTSGNHSPGTESLSAPYTSTNRVRPHLVAPTNQTSFASPLVASTAALLIDLAHDHPALSNGTRLTSAGRNNRTITNAESSEVIRAALMAGANRQAITDAANGFTYAASSTNGLDTRFGAGQLDVYQSYHVISAGEHDARERSNNQDIKLYGFDYEANFVANQTRTYRFSIDEVTREFAATLSWNIDINLELVNGVYQDPAVDLTNLNLQLRDLATGQSVAVSNGQHDTTENLYIPVLGKGDYELVVSGTGFFPGSPWTADYGLAWRFAPRSTPLMGDVNLDGGVSLLDLVALQQNLDTTDRAVWTDGDLNGDGRVNRTDVALLAGSYGGGTLPIAVDIPGIGGSPGANPQAIPEPSSIALAACGGLLVLLARSRRPRGKMEVGRSGQTTID